MTAAAQAQVMAALQAQQFLEVAQNQIQTMITHNDGPAQQVQTAAAQLQEEGAHLLTNP